MFPMNMPRESGVPTPPSVEEALAYTPTNQQTWNPPARWANIDGKWVYAPHQGLVNSNGVINDYYNLNSDPESIWYSMSDTKRSNVIDIFESKGIGARTFPQQLNAFAQLLQQSNALGVTWETTLGRLNRLPSSRTSTGPSYKVANPADLRAVAKTVFKETIGRAATEEESSRFVAAYQQAQRQAAGSGVAAPSAEVAARDLSRIYAPKEGAAYDILGYIGQFVNAVEGVGR